MERVGRLLNWFVPPKMRTEADRAWRGRFLVQAALLGIVLSATFSVVYAYGGWWPGTLSLVLLAALLPIVPLALRLGGSLRLAGHLGLTFSLLAFALPTLFESELDGALLAIFGLLPYLAVLLLDGRAAWLWLGITLSALAGILVSHQLHLFPTVQSASPHFVVLTRVSMMLASTFFFGMRFASERAQAMNQLARVNAMKSAFLANMSHELRTPMNGLLGLTEVMLGEPLAPAQRERLELVHRSGRHLVELLDDVLDVSKIEAGKLVLVPEVFDVHQVLREVAGVYESVGRRKHLALELEGVGDAPLWVRGDPLRLRQVLSNLVSNAVKFTERGRVTLKLAAQQEGANHRLAFEVKDTGVGIAPAVQERIFSPFEQGDPSTTRRYGGTGLGLALSHQLVAMMGGHLTVDSRPREGARFSFDVAFPAASAPPPRVRDTPLPLPEPGTATHEPVLVVDDNPINLKVARALVERAGYTVVTAENGREAVALVQQQRFAAVLMDCHMPEMDGFEATERIRALPGPEHDTPIIALTASAMQEDIDACLRSGMNECVVKPAGLEVLRRALARVLNPPRPVE